MPKVIVKGKVKKFPYTKKGRAAAKEAKEAKIGSKKYGISNLKVA